MQQTISKHGELSLWEVFKQQQVKSDDIYWEGVLDGT